MDNGTADDIVGRVEVTEVDEGSVLRSFGAGVVTLTLNRPDRNNGWTYPLGNRYFDLLDEADADEAVRVIVVTGAGRSFCVGMDSDSLVVGSRGTPRRPAKKRRMTHAMGIRKPIIAAINGACAGFGLVQALNCDIRFAADTAMFSTAFVRRGLAAEYGSSWLLPRIVGHGRAAELLLSGRKFDAEEAERIGLVSRLYPAAELLDATLEYARDMATWCSPIALADTKLQLDDDWSTPREEAEDRAKILSHQPGHRVDFVEGVDSFREKRLPRFARLPARDAEGRV